MGGGRLGLGGWGGMRFRWVGGWWSCVEVVIVSIKLIKTTKVCDVHKRFPRPA